MRNLNSTGLGVTGTFRHPDGRVRSDFEVGSTTEAMRLLLERYPEPWYVLALSSPQTIYTDLRGRKEEGNQQGRGNGIRPPSPPEKRMLNRLGAKHRLVPRER